MTSRVSEISNSLSMNNSSPQVHNNRLEGVINIIKNIASHLFTVSLLAGSMCMSNTLIFSYVANIKYYKAFALSVIGFLGGYCIPNLIREAVIPIYRKVKAKEPPNSKVIIITKKNYQQEIVESKIPVVLQSFSNNCVSCHKTDLACSELSPDLQGKVKFAKFDFDEDKTLSKEKC
jgi:hypothetical protein